MTDHLKPRHEVTPEEHRPLPRPWPKHKAGPRFDGAYYFGGGRGARRSVAMRLSEPDDEVVTIEADTSGFLPKSAQAHASLAAEYRSLRLPSMPLVPSLSERCCTLTRPHEVGTDGVVAGLPAGVVHYVVGRHA